MPTQRNGKANKRTARTKLRSVEQRHGTASHGFAEAQQDVAELQLSTVQPRVGNAQRCIAWQWKSQSVTSDGKA